MSKCDYPGNYVTPRFVGNNPRSSGHLLNDAGDGFAQGINLIVDYQPGGWGINLHNNWTAFAIENQAIRLSGTGNNRFGSKDYYVAYYRQGLSVVTPGKVRTSMQYAIYSVSLKSFCL